MDQQTLPTTLPSPSGRPRAREVPYHFLCFYHGHLRRCAGHRMRTMDVAAEYALWSERTGAPSMGVRAIVRTMVSIGHGHQRSNGMFFRDLAPASLVTELSNNFPSRVVLLSVIDRFQAELGHFRDAVAVIDRFDADLGQLRAVLARQ